MVPIGLPHGRLKLNALRITEKMAILEAKVYRDREDAEPLSSYVANCTLDATPGGLYVEAAQEEALDTALSNAGFGIQFADVGSESEEYGSEVPVGAKAEIAKPVQVKTVAAKPVQTKAEVTESVQKQPEAVKATPQEAAKADPLDAIMADDMPIPEQTTAEVVEKPKTVVLESVQPAQTQAEPRMSSCWSRNRPPLHMQSTPVEEICRHMTYEQAQNVIVDCGTCKGWTLAQVADRRAASALVCERLSGENNILTRGGRHYMGQLAGETGGITGKEAVLHDLIFRYVSVWHCRCSRTAGSYRPPSSAVELVPELSLLPGMSAGGSTSTPTKMSGAATAAVRRVVCWHCMPAITAPAMPMPTARYARRWGGIHPGQG